MMHVLHTHFALKPLVGERRVFEATFNRYGSFDWRGQSVFTVCLCDVRERWNGPVVAQHIWIHSTPEWDKTELARGDIVYFEATVDELDSGKINLQDAELLHVTGAEDKLHNGR